ncbi:MAG TPA: DoxX family protein [Gemmatimonadales bacterium]|nr:DoxX family protein [Gemmatimonadales bacterium]
MHQPSKSWAPLPLRLMLGFAFLYHGLPKLLSGHQQTVAMFQGIGLPAPAAMAWIIGLVEVLGGIALLLGAFTTITSIILILHQLGAMYKVHLGAGYNFVHVTGMSPTGPIFGVPGYEVNLLFIAGLLTLAIGGAGAASVDGARHRAVAEGMAEASPR